MIGNIALYKDDHEDISIKNNKKRDNLKKKIIDVLTSIFAFLWVSYELQKRNNDEFTTELVFCWFGIFLSQNHCRSPPVCNWSLAKDFNYGGSHEESRYI